MTLLLENVVLKLPPFSLRADTSLQAQVSGLSGPSGAGKTTLLEMIAGLRKPDAGRIVLDNEVLSDSRTGRHVRPEKRRIGYVPQDLGLFPHLNAGGNLLFGYRPSKSPTIQPDRVIQMLNLTDLLQQSIALLSGGEKQRVAIGRALLAGPRLLLLDEPMTGLDDALKERVLCYLKSVIVEFRLSVIYVTHSQTELTGLGADLFALNQGILYRD